MLYKTQGIVLNYIKFRETSIICKVYTRLFGLQSYIVNGVRSTKARSNKIALFQPLTLLNLVVYHRKSSNLQRISEIKCDIPLQHIPFDIRKSSIALFITEILNKALREEVEDEALFSFLWEAILILEQQEKYFQNFHIQFLLELSKYLGFSPSAGQEIYKQVFQSDSSIDEKQVKNFDFLIHSTFDQHLAVSASDRRELLDILLKYYRLNIESMGEIKSVQVLQEVLHE